VILKKINSIKNFNIWKNYANQWCQQWTQTFQNWTFVDIKRTNKSKDSAIVDYHNVSDLH